MDRKNSFMLWGGGGNNIAHSIIGLLLVWHFCLMKTFIRRNTIVTLYVDGFVSLNDFVMRNAVLVSLFSS